MASRLLVLLAAISIGTITSHGAPPEPGVVRKMWTPFTEPIPKGQPQGQADKALVDLGRQLFFERALSPDGTRSCNDCHDLAKYGTNGAAALEAREAGELRRDVPSVFNLAELELLRWDGSQTMQVCAPGSGSTWSRSTPRTRGATGVAVSERIGLPALRSQAPGAKLPLGIVPSRP